MIARYAQWVIRHPYVVLFATLVLVMLAASGMRHLTFKNDYRMFFSEDNPELVAFERLQATYSKNDNLLFVIAPKEGGIFTPDALGLVEEFTREAWQIPYVRRVDSITNFQHTSAEGDNLVVDDLVRNAAGYSHEDVARIKSIALKEPLLVDRLVSPEGSVTGINVTLQLPGINEAKEVPEAANFARDLAERMETEHPEIVVHVTGLVAMNAAFSEASARDMTTLIPAMLLLIVIATGVLLRAWTGTLATLLIILLSIAGALGLAGWLGIPLSPTSAAAPNIILMLAVAYCIHVLSSFFQALRIDKKDKPGAIAETLDFNVQPVFIGAVTEAIGFLSMNASDAPPFRDLGNITAMGVGVAFVLSIAFVPAFLAVLPEHGRGRPETRSRLMAALSEFTIRNRKPLFWGMLALTGVMTVFIPKNEINDEYVKYFDETYHFRTATDFTSSHLTGIYYIDYSLEAGSRGGASDPAYLAKMDEFAEWYRHQPHVTHVFTITDIIKTLNKNMHGDDSAYYKLPEMRDLAAQYLLMYEMSLPYGLDLNDRIDLDKSAARLTVTLESISSKEVLELDEKAQVWLKNNAPPSMLTAGTGPTVMFANIGQRNAESMLVGVVGAILLISLVLMIALRSFKYGLLSLVPNLMPIILGFGLWGLLVGQVGLAMAVVASMSLGIVVDDTVHFIGKYLHARRRYGFNPDDAVRYASSKVGPAMWVMSLVLMAGFSVLAFSGFEINSDIGLSTSLIIGLALLSDLLFLPPMLIATDSSELHPVGYAPPEPHSSTT